MGDGSAREWLLLVGIGRDVGGLAVAKRSLAYGVIVHVQLVDNVKPHQSENHLRHMNALTRGNAL